MSESLSPSTGFSRAEATCSASTSEKTSTKGKYCRKKAQNDADRSCTSASESPTVDTDVAAAPSGTAKHVAAGTVMPTSTDEITSSTGVTDNTDVAPDHKNSNTGAESDKSNKSAAESDTDDNSNSSGAESHTDDKNNNSGDESDTDDKSNNTGEKSHTDDKSKNSGEKSHTNDNSKNTGTQSHTDNKSSNSGAESDADDKNNNSGAESDTDDKSHNSGAESDADNKNNNSGAELHTDDKNNNSGDESDTDDKSKNTGEKSHTDDKSHNSGNESHTDDNSYNTGEKSHTDDNTDGESHTDDNSSNTGNESCTDEQSNNTGEKSHTDDNTVGESHTDEQTCKPAEPTEHMEEKHKCASSDIVENEKHVVSAYIMMRTIKTVTSRTRSTIIENGEKKQIFSTKVERVISPWPVEEEDGKQTKSETETTEEEVINSVSVVGNDMQSESDLDPTTDDGELANILEDGSCNMSTVQNKATKTLAGKTKVPLATLLKNIRHTTSPKADIYNLVMFPVFEVGRRKGPEKTIVLIGETGSGKSTLVNKMVNYIMGVNFQDSRVRLMSSDLQAHVQRPTEQLTVYKINHQEGYKISYTLTVVDTPGFGKGTQYDEQVTIDIQNFIAKVGHVDAVCFVMQSSLPRLTATQRYIIGCAKSVLPEDATLFSFLTFADHMKPQILDSLKEAGHEFKWFKFNNCSLYGTDRAEDDQDMLKIYWNMSDKSLNSFFKALSSQKTIC